MRPQDVERIMKLPEDDPSKTAVLIVSCSRYRQLWMPFFTLFRRYWPDCPYTIYFATDLVNGEIPRQPWMDGVVTVVRPDDPGWCQIAIDALRAIPADRVIMFQEDFLMFDKADTAVVRRLSKYAGDVDAACLRLCPSPGPSVPWKEDFLGEITPNEKYRVSLQLAIWNKEVITHMVHAAPNPWLMEYESAKYSGMTDKPFLSVWRESEEDPVPGCPVPYFITAITRGAWEQGALDLLAKEKIPLNDITRIIA